MRGGRPSVTNILAVLLALYVGRCASLPGQEIELVPTPDTVMVFGLEVFEPSSFHALIYQHVSECVGRQNVPAESLVWATANAIVIAPYGFQADGYWLDAANMIIVLRRLKWDASAFGHEGIHAASGVGHGQPGAKELFDRCELD